MTIIVRLRRGTELALGLPGARFSSGECHVLVNAVEAAQSAEETLTDYLRGEDVSREMLYAIRDGLSVALRGIRT